MPHGRARLDEGVRDLDYEAFFHTALRGFTAQLSSSYSYAPPPSSSAEDGSDVGEGNADTLGTDAGYAKHFGVAVMFSQLQQAVVQFKPKDPLVFCRRMLEHMINARLGVLREREERDAVREGRGAQGGGAKMPGTISPSLTPRSAASSTGAAGRRDSLAAGPLPPPESPPPRARRRARRGGRRARRRREALARRQERQELEANQRPNERKEAVADNEDEEEVTSVPAAAAAAAAPDAAPSSSPAMPPPAPGHHMVVSLDIRKPRLLRQPSSFSFRRFVGMDIGGSLSKVTFYEPPAADDPAAAASARGQADFIKSSTEYGTSGTRDPALSFAWRGGTFHFLHFMTSRMDGAVSMIHGQGLVRASDPSLLCTGGGAHRFSDMFRRRLGVELEKLDEMECLLVGLNFMLQNVRDECYYLEDPTRPLRCAKVPFPVQGDIYPYLLVNCLDGATPVLRADGTSVRLDDLARGRRPLPVVYAAAAAATAAAGGGKGRFEAARVSAGLVRGRRRTVELTLEDGRRVVCTPDHRFLAADGRWVEAARLEPGRRVRVGMTGPLDEVDTDEERGFRVGGVSLGRRRGRALAVARLAGRAAAGGGPPGCAADADRLRDDLALAKGARAEDACAALVAPRTPACVVREMAAAALGVGRLLLDVGRARVRWYAPSHALARAVRSALRRLGVAVYGKRRRRHVEADAVGLRRLVGFRYAARESMALERVAAAAGAAALHAAQQRRVRREAARLARDDALAPAAALAEARRAAAAREWLVPRPPVSRGKRRRWVPPAPLEAGRKRGGGGGGGGWFGGFELAVVSRRPAGVRYVYDVTVPGPASFLANGVAAHNCGTGISIIRVDSASHFERVGGSCIGGGTYWGLCRLLTKCKGFRDAMELCKRGDRRRVDMTVGDIYGGDYEQFGLKASTIASAFGKIPVKRRPRDGVTDADVAASLLHLIAANIAQVAYLSAENQHVGRILFAGNFLRDNRLMMGNLTYSIDYWSKGTIHALFLRHEGYCGSLGALLLQNPDASPRPRPGEEEAEA